MYKLSVTKKTVQIKEYWQVMEMKLKIYIFFICNVVPCLCQDFARELFGDGEFSLQDKVK